MRDYWDNLKLFNHNVRFFLLATAVHGFVFFGIYSLLLNLYLLRLGYGPEFIGIVNGLGPLMLALFSLPAGAVSRRFGSRRVMIGGYFMSAVSFALVPSSGLLPEVAQQGWIAGSYALGWASGAFVIVNFAPYLMASTGEQERNHAFAIQSSLFPLAGFLGSFLGGTLPTLFANLADLTLDSPIPYRNALLVAAIIDLLAAWAIWRTDEIKNVAGETAVSSSSSPQASSPPPYRLFLLFTLVSLLTIGGEWTMRVYFNVYLDTELSAPTALIGTISAGALFMGLFALFSPQAAARWGKNRVVLVGVLGGFVAFLPLILIAHWVAVALGYMIMIGAISLNNPTYLVLSQSVVEPRWRNTIASMISMSIGIGVAITSFGGGFIVATYGFKALFMLGAMAGLLAAGIVWWFFPREQSVVEKPVAEAAD